MLKHWKIEKQYKRVHCSKVDCEVERNTCFHFGSNLTQINIRRISENRYYISKWNYRDFFLAAYFIH